MTIVLVLSPNYPVMQMKNEKQKKQKKKHFIVMSVAFW